MHIYHVRTKDKNVNSLSIATIAFIDAPDNLLRHSERVFQCTD